MTTNTPITLNLSSRTLQTDGKRFALKPGIALDPRIKLKRLTHLQLLFSRMTRTSDAILSMC